MNTKKVVTRFAPSPTGFMHVGGVRTALFSYLWAKKNKGDFILRIEDTDKSREVDGSIEHIMESLKWLGIDWDQGPDIGGTHKPYLQSERLDIYKKYAQILIDKGFAYVDPYTEEEVEKLRAQSEEDKKPFLYREHRKDTDIEWTGINQTLRFKINKLEKTNWSDLVFGELSAGTEALDDFVLIKSDGYPTYNFAHVVDDIEMQITHVMRGQEFVSSTPKFLALYDALEITPPIFVSLPHIMAESGNKKLGKRDGAKDILDYKKEGYLPEAMLNFLAFLGWNPGGDKEIMSVAEIIENFDIDRLQKGGAQFNDIKLNWFNREHIKILDEDKQFNLVKEYLPEIILKSEKFTDKYLKNIIPTILDHISTFGEVTKLANDGEWDYFFKDISYDESLLVSPKTKLGIDAQDKIKDYFKDIAEILKQVNKEEWTYQNIKDKVMSYADIHGRGDVLWSLRVALTGREKSPDPFTVCYILGIDEVLKRI